MIRSNQPHRKKARLERTLQRRTADVAKYALNLLGVEGRYDTARKEVSILQAKLKETV